MHFDKGMATLCQRLFFSFFEYFTYSSVRTLIKGRQSFRKALGNDRDRVGVTFDIARNAPRFPRDTDFDRIRFHKDMDSHRNICHSKKQGLKRKRCPI